MNTTQIQMPKLARQFIEDAKAAGFDVRVTRDPSAVDVWVERGEVNAGLTWAETMVWDSPMSAERLGFRTGPGRRAVRFSHGMTNVYGTYTVVKSVRHARGLIGLAV